MIKPSYKCVSSNTCFCNGLKCIFFFFLLHQYCRQYCRHGCGFFSPLFFILDSSKFQLQLQKKSHSDIAAHTQSTRRITCVPLLPGPDCCRSVVGRKSQWLCYQAHYEEAQDLMCPCVDERIISEQKKKENQSHTGLLIELKTDHGNNMMAHVILIKHKKIYFI